MAAMSAPVAGSAPVQARAAGALLASENRFGFACSIADTTIAVALSNPAPAAAAPANISASDLRITLGRLLGEHAYLLMEAMRAAASDRPDLNALASGLDANTADLSAAIETVYGQAASATFERLWQQHIDAAIDWSAARGDNNVSDVQSAEASMADYRTRFSRFLADANPHLSGDAEAHALQLHLDQLTSFIGMNYDQVFATERAAYAHMFEFGDSLAEAIAAQFPDQFTGARLVMSPRTSLRLDLGRYLGEHLVLAAEAMRAGLGAQQGSGAAAASLAANSDDLAALIGRVYGSDAQARFDRLWTRHIDAYLAYIEAIRSQDATKRSAALDELHGYHDRLARLIHELVPALRIRDVKPMIGHHVTALINMVDATAAGDHERSVDVTREAYAHMFDVGDALGNAIADQFPDRFADLKAAPATSTGSEPAVVPAASQIPVAALLVGIWPIAFVCIMWGLRRRFG
jgi:hypothetical protein